MKTRLVGALALFLFLAGVIPGGVLAALKFGSGYYTNLCGSGTLATAYTCASGCSPSTGTCTTTGDGAVRYVCQGNWNQCLENEVGWVNGVSVGDPGCGNTIQLSIYDHKCRRDDGSWDGSCQLLGYMVWYSGDCRQAVAGYATGIPLAPTPTLAPGVSPTVAVVSKFSSPTPTKVAPTVVKVSPTASKTQVVCNRVCGVDGDCASGLFCANGVCRNRDCPTDKTCFCNTQASSTITPAVGGVTTPETGMPLWILGLGVLGLGYLGIKVLHIGKILWD